tara:strand:- start:8519 stop:9175 length:657 start_codon:yes stop_codon:yes gene_type:complete
MKQLNDKDIEAISVMTIDSRRPETIGLIKKHGINLPSNSPTKLVDKAFLSLVKQSDKFREDFSALAHDTSLSFTGTNEGNWFNSFTGKNEGDFFNLTASEALRQAGGASATKVGTTNPAAAATTTETEKKGGFWSYLAQVFTPDTTRDIINTGLNIWSVKQTGQNAATTQNNLDQARFDLQDGGGTTATQGMGVGTIILISVGALALIGGIIYFVRKK